jgi:hypothetical protein
MTDGRRRTMLGLLLSATLAATAWVHQREGVASQEIVAPSAFMD